MTGSVSLFSPLCTWLFAASLSAKCAKESKHALSPPSYNTSRRRKATAAALPMKHSISISSPSNDNSNIKSMLSFKGLMSSSLANEPCSHYYASDELLRSNPKLRRRRRRQRLCPPATSGQAMAVAVLPTNEAETKRKPLTGQRRVVVTGMGVVSPLGHDLGVFYNNLLQGVSGVTQIEAFDCAQFPTRIAGEIKSFSTDGWVAPKLSKRMDKFMLYMLTAGKKALADGGVTEDVMDELNKRKCGVLIGSAMGGMKVFNDAIEALRISYKKMNPFCVPFATTNMGSAMLGMDLGWMGPNYSISTACATSNFCILNAANHIIRGEAVSISCSIHFQQQKCGMLEMLGLSLAYYPTPNFVNYMNLQDVMLCGGSDAAIIPIGLGGFVACRALSQRNDDPTKPSRPWDMNRDGFVMGEGAGVLLLEELEHAKKRGANIYAEFLGGSFTCDAYHMTEPRPDGAGVILCIEKALSQSGISKEDVNYVNAHATSTPAGDLKEYQALMHCFGQNSGVRGDLKEYQARMHCFGQNSGLRVNATKSMIGHLLGAAGAVEAITAIQAIRTGWVHPNINLENPDQGVDTSVLVGPKKERLDIKAALSNSFGFGGHNSSIIFAPFK